MSHILASFSIHNTVFLEEKKVFKHYFNSFLGKTGRQVKINHIHFGYPETKNQHFLNIKHLLLNECRTFIKEP